MNINNPMWPRCAFLFKGGNQAAAIQSAPVPTPAPPVTGSSAEVIQAEQDQAQQNLLKKSVKKTVWAGDTGGFMGPGGGAGARVGTPGTAKKLG